MQGKELRAIRNRLKLTQAQFAEQIGVTTNTVARWERDEVTIREPMARLIRTVASAKKGAR
jgi:DNA-binding transcriptional regulator YiaG